MPSIVSSYNPTLAGAVDSRTADVLTRTFLPRPQSMSIYVRFQERGTIVLNAVRILQIAAVDASPRLYIWANAGLYACTLQNASGSSTTRTLAVAPAIGNIVELVVAISPAGTVTLAQSINGAAQTITSVATVPLPAAWSGTTLAVNSFSNGSTPGAIALLNLLIMRGSQDLPTMRRLAGVGVR